MKLYITDDEIATIKALPRFTDYHKRLLDTREALLTALEESHEITLREGACDCGKNEDGVFVPCYSAVRIAEVRGAK